MTKKEMYRLISDKGKVLTNGTVNATCVDVLKEKADEWTEIDAPVEEEEIEGTEMIE